MTQSAHQPVLLTETLEYLAIKPDGIYFDVTFGRGGHAKAILQRLGPEGRLFAIDKDPEAIASAQHQQIFQDPRFCLRQGSFTQLQTIANEFALSGKIDGILLDLGVSSPQLDDAKRGFSFLHEGPLDMRMDTTTGINAADWINAVPEQELAQVLKEFGEEKFAKRIAAAIVRARSDKPFTTTTQLAAIVAAANPKWERHKNPATRAFQAIRIFINHELDELEICLQQCLEVLAIGGKLLAISFHSLEDRIVKQFLQKQIRGGDLPIGLPLRHDQLNIRLKRVNGAIRPGAEEIADNARARSATLRVMEKIL